MFGLTPEEWKLLDTLAIEKLKTHGCTVWIFGSRSRGDHKPFSDVDLLYSATATLPKGLIYDLKSTLEESDLPFKVDLVNVADLAESYKPSVLRDRRVI